MSTKLINTDEAKATQEGVAPGVNIAAMHAVLGKYIEVSYVPTDVFRVAVDARSGKGPIQEAAGKAEGKLHAATGGGAYQIK